MIAVYGGVVVMHFSDATRACNGGRHGDYWPLPPELLPPLLVAWDERLSKSSGTVHKAMRYRAAIEHDPAVIKAMARKAELMDEAVAGPAPRPPRAARPHQVRTIDIARRHGSHAMFAGSGGATNGTYEDDAHLTATFAQTGILVVSGRVACHPQSGSAEA